MLFDLDWPFGTTSFAGIALGIAVAYTIGHVVASLGSMMGRMYYSTWGGKPAYRVFVGRVPRDFSYDRFEESSALRAYYGIEYAPETMKRRDRVNTDKHNAEKLLTRARILVADESQGRLDAFQAALAFHRSLMTAALLIVFVMALLAGLTYLDNGDVDSWLGVAFIGLLAFTLFIIEWRRARQRAYYYVFEVIDAAYGVLMEMDLEAIDECIDEDEVEDAVEVEQPV
jgi:hypothetical protein